MERKLELCRLSIEKAPEAFNYARAILVADHPGKFSLIKECCQSLFAQAHDYGLAQMVLAASSDDLPQIDAIRKADGTGGSVGLVEMNFLYEAAEKIARHQPGPPAGPVIILPDGIKLKDGEFVLLQRAFHDCEKIYLETISGGKASMSVFRVHAWMKQSVAGPSPLPFFAKIAIPEELAKEQGNYHYYAEHYIPFNLRPNIDTSRCVATRTKAAMVGNFVDDAIPLREALRSASGVGCLFSLFETTLKGFRLQPFATGQKREKGPLETFVKWRIWIDKWKEKAAVVERAKALGLTASVEELSDKICKAAASVPCLTGPNHGDCHTGNVMVRGGDAILIDFGSIMHGPLTGDPANLEVSLMFGTESSEKSKSFSSWKAFVDQIYSAPVPSLHPPALFESQPGPYSWLRRAIRELRHVLLGCEVSVEEAKITLAASLMRFARQDVEFLEEDDAKTLAFDRHAYALVVAERVVNSLTENETGKAAA